KKVWRVETWQQVRENSTICWNTLEMNKYSPNRAVKILFKPAKSTAGQQWVLEQSAGKSIPPFGGGKLPSETTRGTPIYMVG
ncbi:MAG: hypothetical protein Q8P17_04830, partial [bacterium]|nr:hypothetical protein [bacterium]